MYYHSYHGSSSERMIILKSTKSTILHIHVHLGLSFPGSETALTSASSPKLIVLI